MKKKHEKRKTDTDYRLSNLTFAVGLSESTMFRTTSLLKQATALNRTLYPAIRPAISPANASLSSRCTSLTRCTQTSRNLSSKSKDAHQEAIDKAQELHAELKEVRVALFLVIL